jgi:hypothetical protein
MYIEFLMSEPKSSTCTRLSQVMGISHDSMNRFLLREPYEPQDLFNEAKKLLDVVGGTFLVRQAPPGGQRLECRHAVLHRRARSQSGGELPGVRLG